MLEHRIVSVELLTTAKCPLNCRYCYIPKTSLMRELHEEIRRNIKEGLFLENLKRLFPKRETLQFLSFWGTEPSLTLNEIISILPLIFQHFPNLKSINFSTSLLLPNLVFDFISKVNEIFPNLEIDIQISFDGPSFITNKNRLRGGAKIIPRNFLWLISKIQKIRNPIRFKWKSTLDIKNIKDFLKNESRIDAYFKCFEEIEKKAQRINKNPNISLPAGSPPTLVFPGKYTSKDGKIFAHFLRKLHKKQYKTSYSFRLQRIINFLSEFSIKRTALTCSAGDSNIGFYNDTLHWCHRSFYINDKRYVESIFREKNVENWDVSYLKRGTLDYFSKWYIISVNDNFSLSRFFYVSRGFHDFISQTGSFIKAAVKELALTNQADPIFLEDEDLLELFIIFLSGESCPVENAFNTGSIHLPPLSVIRIFANGAFQELLESLKTYEQQA